MDARQPSCSGANSGGEMANRPIFFMLPLFGAGGIPDSTLADCPFTRPIVFCMTGSQFFVAN